MIFVICAVFLMVLLLALTEEWLGEWKVFVYYAFCPILIAISVGQEYGFTNDTLTYTYMFYNYDTELIEITTEFSFFYICRFIQLFTQDVTWMFLVYAVITIPLRMYALQRLADKDKLFLILLMYLSFYFVLHDMTQIRAGVASTFMLLGLKPLIEGKKWPALAYFIIGACFHYSAIIAVPFVLFSNKPLNKWWKGFFIAAIPCSYVIYFLGIDLIMALPFEFVTEKMDAYENVQDKGVADEIDVFYLLLLVKMAIFYFLLFFHDTVLEENKGFPIMMKFFVFYFIFWVSITGIPVIATRMSELFGIVEILLLPMIFYCIKPEYIARLTVILMATIIFGFTYFYLDYVHF